MYFYIRQIWLLLLKLFCVALFILFMLFILIVIINSKGLYIVGIDYCSTAEIDNINPNLTPSGSCSGSGCSEINNTNINENSAIYEENLSMAENPISIVENEQYASETNVHECESENRPSPTEQSLRSKGFLSGTSLLYKNFYNTGRRRFQWYIREQFKDKYNTYKEFKENWNPDISLRAKLREGFKNDISHLATQAKQVNKNIEEKIEKIKYQKRIIVYAYTGRRRRREREKRERDHNS